ncbi:OmpH family outer membrane protein [Flavobacterium sp.]|uniref:OmpH family outer membrane protein n=1 Tax=Flavobacterium sp. TaxID=239 RepID=UPI002B4B414D|nr:OmpH family outer membrane protein [Flavobacterium sp.]HLP63289.1 OmpH family outer membrane protein [Flavobacterium sp.]
MKKIIAVLALSVAFVSCNQNNTVPAKDFKTAYIDTSKLMEESTEAKDIEAKYKDKAAQMDVKLQSEASRLKSEQSSFQANMQKNGEAWAKQKYMELQQREQQLQYAQQGMLQQLQGESGKEMDSLVKKYKQIFKEYGKEKGYDYIYGTGDAATVLYAKDSYDITKELIKLVNSKYVDEKDKPVAKKEEEEKK